VNTLLDEEKLTDNIENGKFTFYKFRPASYPEFQEPEHIHIYGKKSNTIPYYINSHFFDSNSLLTQEKKESHKNRGGSRIIKLQLEDGIWTANRDIILGLNIPNYK